MTVIDATFNQLTTNKEKALITYICGGDPDIKTSIEIAKIVEKYSDVIELGIPFSDPIADGPTIQKATERALLAGTKPKEVLELASNLKKPVVIMTYYNIIYKYGIRKFCEDAKRNNVRGIIIPDLPPEEAKDILSYADGLDSIFLISPSSTDERIKLISEVSSGFIYLVSLLGTTGEREQLSKDAKQLVARVKNFTNKPLALGFGISKSEHVRDALSYGADGVIVGSALVKRIEENLSDKNTMLRSVENFCKELRDALNGSAKHL